MKDPLVRTELEIRGAMLGIDGGRIADMAEPGSYESRRIANTKVGTSTIDTAAVADNPPEFPYETAISDPHYDNGAFIVVAVASTREGAQFDHDIWVQTMTTTKPERLVDMGVSETAMRTDEIHESRDWRIYPRKG